jgi:hypothetical protein
MAANADLGSREAPITHDTTYDCIVDATTATL